jgi:hypothetical protein
MTSSSRRFNVYNNDELNPFPNKENISISHSTSRSISPGIEDETPFEKLERKMRKIAEEMNLIRKENQELRKSNEIKIERISALEKEVEQIKNNRIVAKPRKRRRASPETVDSLYERMKENKNIINIPDPELVGILDSLDEPIHTAQEIISEHGTDKSEQIKEKKKIALSIEEVDEMIDRNKNKDLPESKFESILLKEPNSEELFLEALHADRAKRASTVSISQTLVSCQYWHNKIESVNDIVNAIYEIMERELKKGRNALSFSTTYGFVMEHFNKDNDEEPFSYTIFNPNDCDFSHRVVVDLLENESLQWYVDYLLSELREYRNIPHFIKFK